MYIVLLFLGIAIFGLCIKAVVDKKCDNFMAYGVMLLFVLYMTFTLILLNTPSAMDVYQGKTELKYTVQGGEITDSVVVYKN